LPRVKLLDGPSRYHASVMVFALMVNVMHSHLKRAKRLVEDELKA
jgi:hypothetical protein